MPPEPPTAPTTRPAGGPATDTAATDTADEAATGALLRDLRAAVTGEVEAGVAARAMFSMDASNYRHVPRAVVFPRTADDVAAALRTCRAHGVPVT
ncbi:hypothetical protein, partial [Saccharomonospora iraqiensis]|uniref:hypothetical protein n=1 Tax=Saccharomonospora iraqiensis TaxID=52698 RepID=UPI001F1FB75D